MGTGHSTKAVTSSSNASSINALLPDGATPQQVQQLTAQLGLNQPIYVQFGKYLVNAVQLNFGTSILYSEPVRTLIGFAANEKNAKRARARLA